MFFFILLEILERASVANVNLQKTQCFLIGKLSNEKEIPLDIRWTNEKKRKSSGFYFGNIDVSKDNWEPTIAKIKLLLNVGAEEN